MAINPIHSNNNPYVSATRKPEIKQLSREEGNITGVNDFRLKVDTFTRTPETSEEEKIMRDYTRLGNAALYNLKPPPLPEDVSFRIREEEKNVNPFKVDKSSESSPSHNQSSQSSSYDNKEEENPQIIIKNADISEDIEE